MEFKLLYLNSENFYIVLEKMHHEKNYHEATISPGVMVKWISKKFSLEESDTFNKLKNAINKFKILKDEYSYKIQVIIELNKWIKTLESDS